ncbi:MAG TPA: hypothetical protein VKR06_16965 [Ktedonosporobacter sp.]|nr:hypothetical protein [Ktedonosporobacter sp.]
MSTRTLYRLSGGALIVSSLLIIITSIIGAMLFPGHHSTTQQDLSLPWILITLITFIGSLLFVIGLPGMYLRQAGRAGALGLVGFILLFLGFLLQGAAFSALQVTVLPWIAQVAPKLLEGENLPIGVFLLLIVSGLMMLTGSILLGIATIRAHVFPRWTGILLLASGILFLLTLPPLPSPLDDLIEIASFIALALACLWCGYLLMGKENGKVQGKPSIG